VTKFERGHLRGDPGAQAACAPRAELRHGIGFAAGLNMTTALALVPVLLLASAGPAPAPAPVTAARAVEPAGVPSRVQLSVAGVWLPAGMINSNASGESSSSPASTAYGLAPSVDARITDHLTLGLSLPVLFNVNIRGQQQDPFTELDALVRLAAWRPVASGLRVYGFAAPGYYLILPPAGVPQDDGDAHGFLVALGAGATVDVDEHWFLSAEMGAQAGFHAGGGAPGTASPNATVYLRTGLGAGVRF
jgi:hypothetical protein